MLAENAGVCHWGTRHLCSFFQTHKASHTLRILSTSLGYPMGLSWYSQGSWSGPLANWAQLQWVSGAGWGPEYSSIAAEPSHSTPHLEIAPFYKGTPQHHSISQSVKIRNKPLKGSLPNRQPADGQKTSSCVWFHLNHELPSSWPWVTSLSAAAEQRLVGQLDAEKGNRYWN